MECRHLMARPAYTVKPSAPIEVAATMMRDFGIGFLPVCDNAGRLLGVVTDRDIVTRACAEGLSPALTSVAHIMTRDVVACRESDDVTVAEAVMIEEGRSRVVVLDSHGRLAGVLGIADLARGLDADSERFLRRAAERDAPTHH